jgi:hypothetical protein
MSSMRHDRVLSSVLLGASLALAEGLLLLHAQSASDTLGLAGALGDVIADEASHPGDHQAPFILNAPSGSVWDRALAAALQSRHPDVLAPIQANALHLSVSDVTILGDTAHTLVAWSRCTTSGSILNWWEHLVTYTFIRHSATGWRFVTREPMQFADGHC